MRDAWEEDSTHTWPLAMEGSVVDELDEITMQYLAAHRKTTQPCPLCGMKNALSSTEAALGYICEDCREG